ncbi:MAG: SDR family oxidoreductase [Micromonosporaceae bacterium]|nr:SDR family oxidoreductase [Micromonosporaceae bacterium]
MTAQPDPAPAPPSHSVTGLFTAPRPFPAVRTAIVTGAATERGIGRAVAVRLARKGWHLGLIDVDGPAVSEAAKSLADRYGVQTLGVAADLTDEPAAREAVRTIAASLPQIVALANVAGVTSALPYLDLATAAWHRIIDINVHGVHYVTQPVANIMAANRIGRIVTISSVSAQRGGGTFGKTPYSVSKAAVIGFTRSLARELGPYDVTVNAVAPGPIDTGLIGPIDDARAVELTREQFLRRLGTADDVAAAVEFLLSEDAGFITGQTLNVNGGLYLQ